MSSPASLGTLWVLVRYWVKGRFTKGTLAGLAVGEGFSIIFILFGSSTYLAFSNKVGLSTGLSEVAGSLLLAIYLVGLIQSGFNGSGLPVSGSDVDYVFTSPVPPRQVFAAKVLLNSLTTVLFGFPPILVLYLRFTSYYDTSWALALLAGLVTLVFLVIGLLLSADITLSLGHGIGKRKTLWRNSFIALVLAISLLPITLLIPGIPDYVALATRVFPNGLAAAVSVGLVSGTIASTSYIVDLVLLFAWLIGFLALGVRLARGHFYELLEVSVPGMEKFDRPNQRSRLNTRGKSLWSAVRSKERILISRTREARALLINALFLSGFLVIYALSGSFQSSPTSFLFILFIIGSFGSGTASRWIEKERLWILKSSAVSMRRYVKEVYRARVAPLLFYLSPVTVAVGVPLVASQLDQPSLLLGVILALPGALEIASITMAGGMYFASKYGQSSTDDILSSQAQELADIRRFLFQTVINLAMVSPVIVLVLLSELLATSLGPGSIYVLAVGLVSFSFVFT
ncbi:MAG TPA: putative ABC exporter domain-containing protein, partial [Candidatus Bathyarchaeia archaeon]|nr:putative ABC exporter domain-containing protein [Candidatus Bathyarchaeia archaeon]